MLDRFVRNLEKKYPGEIFCLICSVGLQEELDGITARFHLYREGEFYICKDLEGSPNRFCIVYSEPRKFRRVNMSPGNRQRWMPMDNQAGKLSVRRDREASAALPGRN